MRFSQYLAREGQCDKAANRLLLIAFSLSLPSLVRATVEAYVSPGIVLTDVREYAGTGFGNESTHSVRLDLRVYPVYNDFQYVIPTYPPNYSVFNVRKYASKSFWIDSAYQNSLTKEGQAVSSSGFPITQITNFQYRFPGAASRNVTESWGFTIKWDVLNPNGTVTHDVTDSYSATYTTALNLTRQNIDVLSLDSRRIYGQPNLDGEIPADPNAELRNPSFIEWTFKGGLFVGGATGNDQSGTARMQAWIPTATGGLMSSLTFTALGQPKNYGAPTLQVFAPSTSDPNLGATPSTVTWANRWDLSTATLLGDATAVGTLPPNEYFRVKLLQVPAKIGVALTDETSGWGLWQYFASAAYETGYPLPDSRPRLWTVAGSTTNEIHTWQYWNGTVPPGGGTTDPPGGGTTNPPGGGTTDPPGGGTTPPGGGTTPPGGGTTDPGTGVTEPGTLPGRTGSSGSNLLSVKPRSVAPAKKVRTALKTIKGKPLPKKRVPARKGRGK